MTAVMKILLRLTTKKELKLSPLEQNLAGKMLTGKQLLTITGSLHTDNT